MPLKQLEADYRIEPGPDGTSTVTFEVAYEMKMGLLGKAMGATVVQGKLRKMTALVLAGLDRHLSTGEVIGKDFKAA